MNKHFYIGFLLLLSFLMLSNNTCAQKFTEYEVKIVYLYQFVKFVNWPDNSLSSKTEFTIGIYGENPFGDLPDIIFENKLFKGKPCKVINIETAEEAQQCQLIFINGLSKYETIKFIKLLNKAPVLLVGNNIEDFCLLGGMINFTAKEADYRFEVNPESAMNSTLNISSKLFSVAKVIHSNEAKF